MNKAIIIVVVSVLLCAFAFSVNVTIKSPKEAKTIMFVENGESCFFEDGTDQTRVNINGENFVIMTLEGENAKKITANKKTKGYIDTIKINGTGLRIIKLKGVVVGTVMSRDLSKVKVITGNERENPVKQIIF